MHSYYSADTPVAKSLNLKNRSFKSLYKKVDFKYSDQPISRDELNRHKSIYKKTFLWEHIEKY